MAVRRRNWHRTAGTPYRPASITCEIYRFRDCGLCRTGPASSDVRTAIFVSSNPIGPLSLSQCARRYSAPPPRIAGFGSAALLSSLTAEGRCGMARIGPGNGSQFSDHLKICACSAVRCPRQFSQGRGLPPSKIILLYSVEIPPTLRARGNSRAAFNPHSCRSDSVPYPRYGPTESPGIRSALRPSSSDFPRIVRHAMLCSAANRRRRPCGAP